MKKKFDIARFCEYKEDSLREVKKAKGGLPKSLWETYSAMANTNGGVIVLGVEELADRTWVTTGLSISEKDKLVEEIFNNLQNPQKVSVNILSERDVETYEIDGDLIIVINVPRAYRSEKPVYINNDILNGSYIRINSGDYHCTSQQIKAMLRDASEDTMDMQVLEEFDITVLNSESVQSYRNRHRVYRNNHPFNKLSDKDYLLQIGAIALGSDDKLHPTGAGLLMFGDEYNIVRYYPEYFLDYREMLDPTIKWTDRLHSSSGEWSGNIFDFYFKVYNKIALNIKTPFRLIDGIRVDDTDVHRVIREILANCLVNTDYYLPQGIVIKYVNNSLIIENPGSIRVGKSQMKKGGKSDPRNKSIMKMFNLIGVGERAGSGVPELFDVWENQGWEEPTIVEEYSPNRTVLVLKMENTSINTITKTGTIPVRLNDSEKKIIAAIRENPYITLEELAELLKLSKNGVRYNTDRLKEKGIIKRLGSTRGGLWNIIDSDS